MPRLGLRLPILVLALLLALPVAAIARPAATEVRIARAEQGTEIAIAFTGAPRYRVFTLVGPDRVVVDLDEVDFRVPDSARAGSGPIKSMRFGLFQPGTSRMVLDMAGPYAIQTAGLLARPGGGSELVLKLAPVSPGEAAGRSGQIAASTLVQTASLATTPLPAMKPRVPGAPPPRIVVAIDAGHGGVDPGALGVGGVHEKTVTLAYARELKVLLERSGRFKVVLTRDRDQFLRLRDRIAVARRAGAQLFISLHADSHPDSSFRGASVYTLSEEASDSEAAALAAKENKADLIAGIDLSKENETVTSILIDLAQRETKNLSAQFAAMLVKELGRQTRLIRNTHRFAGFAVLKSPDVASVLVELGYLSNRADEKQLLSNAYRTKLSQAVVKAVHDYFEWQESLRRS
ncbi:MAG TPA: N-acetylmuramoyl-L-alanine amidase [Methylomirabilota bacterium]|jgi:N-acetylmuramoyl-L-alanine amidase|nr:N-acetylmuramoyl-L-alanine amidase [Methylomirabilota bacterium]